MKSYIKKISVCLLLPVLCLTGCGKDAKLAAYEEKMSSFFSTITELHSNMNAIDASADAVAAQAELLAYLDAMELEFNNLAALEVPEEFISVETLADEAAENMTQAVELYHQFFEGEEASSVTAEAAAEYYSRANIRLQYIISILHGEIPEGENVTVTMDNELEQNLSEEPTEEEVIETHGEIETENPLEE